MIVDTHLHTEFSTDSKLKINELKSLLDKNIKLIITDHYDLKFPIKDKFIFDINEYFKKYKPLKEKNILLGIELGLRTDCYKENKKIVNSNNFDYILGSVHLVNGMDIYQKEYYYNKTKKEAYDEYFRYIFDCLIKNDFIDVLGHIDYISRYSVYENKEIIYNDHNDILDKILITLIEKNIVLELNTRLIDEKIYRQSIYEILKKYKYFGGKDIAIGSDAHKIKDIFKDFEVANKLIDSLGLKKVYFENRIKYNF